MKTEESIQSSIEELRALLKDAEHALANAGGEADERILELRERMRAALAEGQNQFARVRERTRDQLDRCDEYVRTKPYQALGIAAAVGTFFGLLLSRRGG